MHDFKLGSSGNWKVFISSVTTTTGVKYYVMNIQRNSCIFTLPALIKSYGNAIKGYTYLRQ